MKGLRGDAVPQPSNQKELEGRAQGRRAGLGQTLCKRLPGEAAGLREVGGNEDLLASTGHLDRP